MMEGNPNSWWSMFPLPPPPHHHQQQPSSWIASPPSSSIVPSQYVLPSSAPPSSLTSSSSSLAPENHGLPQSWSQLLFGGMPGDEEMYGPSHYQSKKQENWEDQTNFHPSLRLPPISADHLKQEVTQNGNFYGHVDDEEVNNFQAPRPPWSSSSSGVTSTSSNMLDFSCTKADGKSQNLDQSSESNSTATGGICKKARLQPTSKQPPLKVRKEKLGDRITALHQLVSPFGKTDTASILLEAIGYIRFLQGQIEAHSTPYLGSTSTNMRSQQSLLNDICLKRKGAHCQDDKDKPKDLRSRGLCLVPVSCTQHVESDNNGADYWAPAIDREF